MTSSSPSTQDSEVRMAVLLLAAGEGSRLGKYPKVLLHQGGRTLLECFASAIQGFGLVEFIVVTGFHAQLVEPEIAKINSSLAYPMKIIKNVSPEEGQSSSVRLGLETFRADFDVLLVALSDQPEVGAREIQELLDEYAKREDGQEIILPMVEGRRGNPVLFSYKAVSGVLASPGMVCRVYMDAHPDKVRAMHTGNQAFVMDVDTPEDIQRHKLNRFSF
ncbi:NTP transferase domain-containing protein [Polynucleobacter sp. JS-Mosq-20-D10]|uniref:nucleotidyltransferase family protein n=1 Tax=Polynucleobacter sp. JS-Mosq-20-D10 TaxID=2576922 RepID=UPI001BFE9FD9|nr:nucleotidyltransferase family protein [Polynucleobacter sp. JS-Mosq-20-D10]